MHAEHAEQRGEAEGVGGGARRIVDQGGGRTGAPTTAAIDSKIKTLDDVRSTLTADGVLDFDQADCIVNTLRGTMPDKDIVTTFATADLTRVAADRSAAVVKAFGTCVPKESIMKPLAQGVQETAKPKV